MDRTVGHRAIERVVGRSAGAVPGRLRTSGRAILPSGRAVLGALLLAVSGVATFVAWQGSAVGEGPPSVVARRPVAPGRPIVADDLRVVSMALPPEQATRVFGSVDQVVGRVAYGPIDEGELVQEGQLSSGPSAAGVLEVAVSLPRDRALDGSLRSGDRVDVFMSDDVHTEQIAADAQVVTVSWGDDATLVAGDEIVVTLALERPEDRLGLIDAARRAEVTLTRSAGAPSEEAN
jgi:Flp pilus assembly protein CpaB